MERQRFGAGCLYGGALVGDEYTDRERRELSFVVSTDHPHRNGNIVHTSGLRYEAFDRNPLLLLSHDAGERSSKALPLGKWVRRATITLPDGVPGVMMRARYLDEETFGGTGETYQLALAVYLMALDGMLNATSIGWLAVEDKPPRRRRTGGLEFEAAELVEVSQALIPANPHTLRVEASMGREVLSLGVKRGVLKADQAELLGRYVGGAAAFDIASIGGSMAAGAQVTSEWTALGREAHLAGVGTGDPSADEPAPVDPPTEAPASEPTPVEPPPAPEPPVEPTVEDDGDEPAGDDEPTGGEGSIKGAQITATESRRRESVKSESAVVARRTSAAASPLARYVAMAGSAELDTAWARTMASCGALASTLGALGLIVGAESSPYLEGGSENDGQDVAIRRAQTALNLAEDVVANLSAMSEILAFGPVVGEVEATAPVEIDAASEPSKADQIAALGVLHGLIKASLTPDPPPEPEPPAPEPEPDKYTAALTALQETFRKRFAENGEQGKAA